MDSFASLPGVQIRVEDEKKGKGLFATRQFGKGDVVFEENPFISCQFAWNKAYGYLACDFCMRPMESLEQNVRRLTARSDVSLPRIECYDWSTDSARQCHGCDTKYCSDVCRDVAFQMYHQSLCHHSSNENHPLEKLIQVWKGMHYPPETANISLVVRILAIIKQSPNPETMCSRLKTFCHRTVNEDAELIHKLLGDKFIGQLDTLREMTAQVISGPYVDEFLTTDGFCSLMALIGTNGQGIGTSPFAQWVNNVSNLNVSPEEKHALDKLIDNLYNYMEEESGAFLNTEGSGLYQLQSSCNHSCVPNAEATFPYNNHRLQLKALSDINAGDEIFISYLDECMLSRSRHSRQKELTSNYLFHCSCEKCISQSCDKDETSVEEMSEDDDEVQDMSD